MAKVDAAVIARIADTYHKDPHRLMDVVRDVHGETGYLSEEAIDAIARAMGVHRVQVEDMASFYSFFDREPAGKCTIRLSNCVVDQMHGMKQVAAAFEKELGIRFGETTPDGVITLKYTSCVGMCDQGPVALVGDLVLTGLKPEDVPAIVEAIRKDKGQVGKSDLFPNAEVQLGIRQVGPVVLAPFENGSALRRALNMSPEGVIEEVNKSKLRGRGGAGFPTGMKWSFCRKAPGAHYIVCNADEGEPGTFKDRVILTESADLLFEGMTVAGFAIGAQEGLLYLRAEYAYLWPHLEQVLARRRRHGLLGSNVAGREGFDFDIRIQMGAGAYVCGEESSLIESLEGKRGAPRDRPPYPVQKGYLNQPTSVNNVETLCAAARVLEKGAEWFAGFGTRDSTGTKLLSVSGDCERPGIYEVEYGLTVDQLLELVGGADAQAVQVGGPSGQCLAPKDFGRRISFEDMPTGGSFIVFGPQRDILEIVQIFNEFFVEESCGWCVPCRVGTTLLKMKMDKILSGKGTASDLEELRALGNTVKTMSRCGLGQTAGNPVLTTLQNFPHLYQARITDQEFIPYFDIESAFSEYCEVTGRKFADTGEHKA
ncbi:MAG: NAD(P)H-dependent oxidoreductase subunit E [Spirochaetales bacterium]|nr:NAD(P)H-dependent oxidoreductase subunit E [Spirochaetales bacterium]